METLSDKLWFDVESKAEHIHIDAVKEFIKQERKILDGWIANLKRNEVGDKIVLVKDLLNLTIKLNQLAGDKFITITKEVKQSK